MITGWVLTALILAISGVVLERGRKRQQKALSASAAAQFALRTNGGVWSVARGEAVRTLVTGHRVLVRGTTAGWEVDFVGYRVGAWLPVAMVRGQVQRNPSIVDDTEAFDETFVPWDEGDQLRLDRFRRLLCFREVRVGLRDIYNDFRIARFVSSATKVSIGVRLVSGTDTTAEAFVEQATELMTLLERAQLAAQRHQDTLPDTVEVILEGHVAASASPTGAPLGIPSAEHFDPRR